MRQFGLRRRQLLAAVAAATGGGAGCVGIGDREEASTDPNWQWPTLGADEGNTWRAPSATPPFEQLTTVQEWSIGGVPRVAAADNVAALAGDALVALDGAFETRWRRDDGDEPGWLACSLGQNRLFAYRRDGIVHAFDAETGTVDWTQDLGKDWVRLFPTDETLFLLATDPEADSPSDSAFESDSDGEAVAAAYNADTGTEVWRQSLQSYGSAALGPEHFVAVDYDAVIGLDRATGEKRWRFESDDRIDGRSTLAAGTVLVAKSAQFESGLESWLVAIDAASGDRLWDAPVDPESTYLPLDGRVYLVDQDTLVSFDLREGEKRAHSRPAGGGFLTICETGIYAVSETITAARSPADPQVEAHQLAARPLEPALVGEALLVPRADGTVVRLGLSPTVRTVLGDDLNVGSDRAVLVAPGSDPRFEPGRIRTSVGTTVHFGWAEAWGGLDVVERPEDAGWEPPGGPRSEGEQHAHTFSVPGRYEIAAESGGESARGTIFVDEPGELRHVTVGHHEESVYDPATLRIETGTTVRWSSREEAFDVQSHSQPDEAEWDARPESAHARYEYTFETPGRYGYHGRTGDRGKDYAVVYVVEE